MDTEIRIILSTFKQHGIDQCNIDMHHIAETLVGNTYLYLHNAVCNEVWTAFLIEHYFDELLKMKLVLTIPSGKCTVDQFCRLYESSNIVRHCDIHPYSLLTKYGGFTREELVGFVRDNASNGVDGHNVVVDKAKYRPFVRYCLEMLQHCSRGVSYFRFESIPCFRVFFNDSCMTDDDFECMYRAGVRTCLSDPGSRCWDHKNFRVTRYLLYLFRQGYELDRVEMNLKSLIDHCDEFTPRIREKLQQFIGLDFDTMTETEKTPIVVYEVRQIVDHYGKCYAKNYASIDQCVYQLGPNAYWEGVGRRRANGVRFLTTTNVFIHLSIPLWTCELSLLKYKQACQEFHLDMHEMIARDMLGYSYDELVRRRNGNGNGGNECYGLIFG